VAPDGWAWGNDPERSWASVEESTTAVDNPSSPQTATATGIGWGYWNTRAIVLQGNTDSSASAAALADSYMSSFYGSELDDWYLPSKDELNQMYEGLGTGFFEGDHSYWSSSEHHALGDGAWEQSLGDGSAANSEKNENLYVRPVRAF